MSSTILYPLLLLLFSCTCMSQAQQEERMTPAEIQLVFLRSIYSELAQLKTRLEASEEQLQQLRRNEEYKVAFGASLGDIGNFGPFSYQVTLVYQNVYVNAGNAYNSTTGIFTAPVKGIYFFTFSGHNLSSKPMGLRLVKNGQHVVIVYNHPQGNRYETATNSMSLILEEGDQVYVRLLENTWVFNNANDHTTFVGHLLFPL